MIDNHSEGKVPGGSSLCLSLQRVHKEMGGGQSEHVYDSVGWNTTKGLPHTHFLEVRKGNLLFLVIWALFVFYGPWVTLALCVYSHALFGLRRTTCACELWHTPLTTINPAGQKKKKKGGGKKETLKHQTCTAWTAHSSTFLWADASQLLNFTSF